MQQSIDLEVRRTTDRMTGLARAAVPALLPGGDLRDVGAPGIYEVISSASVASL